MKTNDYRVVPNFMVKALRGEPLTVHDKGDQTRTFCYISDAVTGFLKVLLSEKNGEIYNVGNDNDEISIANLAKMISELAPKPVKVELIDYPESYPAGEPRRRCPDLTKIKNHFGFHPSIDLRTGLARTMQWYLSLPELSVHSVLKKTR
jgi:UDP-glucuronate decarboxylase